MLDICPFCNNKNTSAYRENQRKRNGEVCTIYICNDCGLLYPGHRMDNGESRRYLKNIHTNKEDFIYDDPTVIDIKNHLKQWQFIKKYAKNEGNALDIGTFEGKFCIILEALGYNAYGLEPQETVASYARSKGIRVFKGSFPEDIPRELSEKSFSLISIMETIYYFHNLRKCLNKVFSLLEDSGLLLIKCHQGLSRYYNHPNHSYFDRYGDYVQGIPTLNSLMYILDQTGFQLIEVLGQDLIDTLPVNVKLLRSRFLQISLVALYNRLIMNTMKINLKKADRLIIVANKKRGNTPLIS